MSRKKYWTAIWAMVIIFGMNFTFGSNLQVFRGFNLRSDKSFDNFQFLVAIWAMNVPKDYYYFTPRCNLGYERNKNNDTSTQ